LLQKVGDRVQVQREEDGDEEEQQDMGDALDQEQHQDGDEDRHEQPERIANPRHAASPVSHDNKIRAGRTPRPDETIHAGFDGKGAISRPYPPRPSPAPRTLRAAPPPAPRTSRRPRLPAAWW